MVSVKVGDIFDLDGAIVVGCTTTFDTSIEDGTISKSTIQGQYTTRYFPYVCDLDAEIGRELAGIAYTELDRTKKPFGKTRLYEHGTVATVGRNTRLAYFVAISTLNERGSAQGRLDHLLDALPQLWEHVGTSGEFQRICVPILGSGRARISTPRNTLVQEIIKSIVAATRSRKFSEHVTIAISPQDFRDGKVDFEELRKYLEYECVFGSGARAGKRNDSVQSHPVPLRPL